MTMPSTTLNRPCVLIWNANESIKYRCDWHFHMKTMLICMMEGVPTMQEARLLSGVEFHQVLQIGFPAPSEGHEYLLSRFRKSKNFPVGFVTTHPFNNHDS